jgi:hypothetical protein
MCEAVYRKTGTEALTEQGDESISHRLLQTDCNAPKDRISKTERSTRFLPSPPSPLRDNDDFFFLRRDVDCFTRSCRFFPFLSQRAN